MIDSNSVAFSFSQISLWTKYAYISVPGSMLFWMGFFPLFAIVGAKVSLTPEYAGIVGPLYSQPVFWLTIVLLPLFCNMRDFTYK